MVSKTAARIGSIVFRILLNHFIEVMYGLSGHPGCVMSYAIDEQFGSRGWPWGVSRPGWGSSHYPGGWGCLQCRCRCGGHPDYLCGGRRCGGRYIGAGVATTVVGAGAITTTGVGMLVGMTPGDVDFNLTATVWLESISI